MYPVFLEPNAVCESLGECKVRSLVAKPTCEDCVAGVNGVAAFISNEEMVVEVIEFLKVTIINTVLLLIWYLIKVSY